VCRERSDSSLNIIEKGFSMPALSSSVLYVGGDVSKESTYFCLISPEILQKYKRYEKCPTFSVKNSRIGFSYLLSALEQHCSLQRCYVLLERTGHYHKSLESFLNDNGVAVYLIHAHKRVTDQDKSDKADAQHLANHLYNQLHHGIQFNDKKDIARRNVPMTDTAKRLHGLQNRRFELGQQTTIVKNKLMAILDEVFPEFTDVIKGHCGQSALNIREALGTPTNIAKADISTLQDLRSHTTPGNDVLKQLQEVAATSIGNTDTARVEGLLIEQKQLIQEYRLIEQHKAFLDKSIQKILLESREGQMILSIPSIGQLTAAAMIAIIGNIDNFEKPSQLRKYFGWSAQIRQSGTSLHREQLTKGGSMQMKNLLHMTVMSAIKTKGSEWELLYHFLVPQRCHLDPEKDEYEGKLKIFGYVVNEILGVVFYILKKDSERCKKYIAEGNPLPLPPPILYNTEERLRVLSRKAKMPEFLAARIIMPEAKS
jgi:transposase